MLLLLILLLLFFNVTVLFSKVRLQFDTLRVVVALLSSESFLNLIAFRLTRAIKNYFDAEKQHPIKIKPPMIKLYCLRVI